jgi:hypothetical protein
VEGELYNVTAGSKEITAEGYPAAFYPVKVHGKNSTEFVVVFPVRATSSCPQRRAANSPIIRPVRSSLFVAHGRFRRLFSDQRSK